MAREKFSEFSAYSLADLVKAGVYIVGVDEALDENIKIPGTALGTGNTFKVNVVNFVNQTHVVVNHNLGRPPIIIIKEQTTGQEIICSIIHDDDLNTFTIDFNPVTTGTIYYY